MADARLFDRGYKPYEGHRTGMPGAARSLWMAAVQRGLGLRREGREKALPFLVLFLAFVPAFVIIAFSVISPDPAVIPHYSLYYVYITAAILLFTALVAPESLCNDRRSGLLSLYLASALTRSVYVAMKAGAVAAILLLVTIAPVLLMLLGLTFTSHGPDGFADAVALIGRILGAGIVLALFFTSIAMSVSSLTDRRTLASAGIIMLVLGTQIASRIIISGLGAPDWVQVIDLRILPFELVHRIFGQPGFVPSLETPLLIAATSAWTIVAYGILWIRYQKLRVTR